MRPLMIGPSEKAAIAKVVAYAMEPEHFYRIHPGGAPLRDGPPPGDDPNFVAHIPDGFRCVFTLTQHEGLLFRHLSVSVPDPGRRPSPEAMVMLAGEFGFTASDGSLDLLIRVQRDGWMVSEGHQGVNCIVVVQPVAPGGPHA